LGRYGDDVTTSDLLPDIGSDPRRLVRLDAVHNFRDMGGYPTVDGRSTKWGMLFRADGLYRLTGDDLEAVRSLGLNTVIDLRTFAELEERGTFPRDEHPVHFHHVPIIDATWDVERAERATDAADFLESAYLAMLDEGEHRLAEALATLCVPGALPAVFHCAAGKDRTGMLAMLVLGCLDVRSEYIIADYALTAEGMERMLAWSLREYPELHDRIMAGPAVFSAAVPEAMSRMIDHVCSWHGTIREFALAMGVPSASIEHLRDELLD
jgi:protein-tyrosine phosphatase